MANCRTIDVVLETPKGSRNKFKYEPAQKGFKLSKVLPAGYSFPYDFGFIPNTKAEDGDPLDVLVLMEDSGFPGCIVSVRLVGAFEIEQTEEGQTNRNDRLIAVAEEAASYSHIHTLKDVDGNLLKELKYFFECYPVPRGAKVKVLAVRGPQRASTLMDQAKRKSRRRRSAKRKSAK